MTDRRSVDHDRVLRTLFAVTVVIDAMSFSIMMLLNEPVRPFFTTYALISVAGFAWTWKLVRN